MVSFDVVNACGELAHVTRASDPELFWALRGGGGDFGIVVRVELALFAAPELYGGQLLWPVEHAPAVLRAFRDLALVAPRELTLWAHVLHFPPMPEMPEPLRGRSFVNVAATYLGSPELADALLWSLRDAAPVEMDLMRPFLPSQLGEVAAEPVDPMPAMEHSMLLTALDDEAIDALLAVVGDRQPLPADDDPDPRPRRRLRRGQPRRRRRPPRRRAVPADVDRHPRRPRARRGDPARLRRPRRRARPARLATGCPTSPAPAQADAAGYDAARLDRLRAIKRERDPDGVIREQAGPRGVSRARLGAGQRRLVRCCGRLGRPRAALTGHSTALKSATPDQPRDRPRNPPRGRSGPGARPAELGHRTAAPHLLKRIASGRKSAGV